MPKIYNNSSYTPYVAYKSYKALPGILDNLGRIVRGSPNIGDILGSIGLLRRVRSIFRNIRKRFPYEVINKKWADRVRDNIDEAESIFETINKQLDKINAKDLIKVEDWSVLSDDAVDVIRTATRVISEGVDVVVSLGVDLYRILDTIVEVMIDGAKEIQKVLKESRTYSKLIGAFEEALYLSQDAGVLLDSKIDIPRFQKGIGDFIYFIQGAKNTLIAVQTVLRIGTKNTIENYRQIESVMAVAADNPNLAVYDEVARAVEMHEDVIKNLENILKQLNAVSDEIVDAAEGLA